MLKTLDRSASPFATKYPSGLQELNAVIFEEKFVITVYISVDKHVLSPGRPECS